LLQTFYDTAFLDNIEHRLTMDLVITACAAVVLLFGLGVVAISLIGSAVLHGVQELGQIRQLTEGGAEPQKAATSPAFSRTVTRIGPTLRSEPVLTRPASQ
jgi:hypothetical protein